MSSAYRLVPVLLVMCGAACSDASGPVSASSAPPAQYRAAAYKYVDESDQPAAPAPPPSDECEADCSAIEDELQRARAAETAAKSALDAAQSALDAASAALDAVMDGNALRQAESELGSFIQAYLATHGSGAFSGAPSDETDSYIMVSGVPLHFDHGDLSTVMDMLDSAALDMLKANADAARTALRDADIAYRNRLADFGAARDAYEAAQAEVARLAQALEDCLRCQETIILDPEPLPPEDGHTDEPPPEEPPEESVVFITKPAACTEGAVREVPVTSVRVKNDTLSGFAYVRLVDFQGTHGFSDDERQALLNGFADAMTPSSLLAPGWSKKYAGTVGGALYTIYDVAKYGAVTTVTDVATNGALGAVARIPALLGAMAINNLRVGLNNLFQGTVMGGRLYWMKFDVQRWTRPFTESKQRVNIEVCRDGTWRIQQRDVVRVNVTWGTCNVLPPQQVTVTFGPYDFQPTNLGGQIAAGVRRLQKDFDSYALGACE